MLTVFQIYFDQSQLSKCEPEYNKILNSNCNEFFENQVIADIISDSHGYNSEYVGFVSYKLRDKLGYMKDNWKSIPNIANHSTTEFTPDLFLQELIKHKPDAMSFQRHIPHDPIMVADCFHPGFKKHFEYIMKQIGFDWQPTHLGNVFYCNYFVAKSEIYQDYVKTMLIPAMEVMKNMPELWNDSRYPHALPKHLADKFGITHYPYHPFICERMFSWYAHLKKLNCLHY